MQQTLRLLAHGLHEHRMPVTKRAYADAREKIPVLRAVIAHQRHTAALDELHGHARERVHHIAGFKCLLQTKRHLAASLFV